MRELTCEDVGCPCVEMAAHIKGSNGSAICAACGINKTEFLALKADNSFYRETVETQAAEVRELQQRREGDGEKLRHLSRENAELSRQNTQAGYALEVAHKDHARLREELEESQAALRRVGASPVLRKVEAPEAAPDHDPVKRPKHYTSHPSGIECKDVAGHFNFFVGNAFKYLWRAGLKGDALEDLRKAAEYVGFEIERIQKVKG